LSQSAVSDITVYGNITDEALGFSRDLHAHCRAGLLSCEPLYEGQFNNWPMPGWLNVIDTHNLAWKCDPLFGHTYYRDSAVVLADITGIVLDQSPPMTTTTPMRPYMDYSDNFGTITAPHFWINSNECLKALPDPTPTPAPPPGSSQQP
jgi:hypothetical protein